MIDYVQMGKRIKQRRKELHLTQEALAEQVDISASFMGHIERGSRITSLETLLSICIALDVSMDYIIGRAGTDLANTLPDTLTEDQRTACREVLTVLLDRFGKTTQ
jgi:transcriptional regulator with XRE-family HTH domain